MTAQLLFIHALSPIHAGTGHSVGAVDLAIARDKATGFPVIPGSSIKGALRAKARELELPNIEKIFGPDTNHASDHAGALVVSDANLLLLPVRSVAGTFAWTTSPFLLQRLARDVKETQGKVAISAPRVDNLDEVHVGAKSLLTARKDKPRAVFEDVELTMLNDKLGTLVSDLQTLWAHQEPHKTWTEQRLAVVHDDLMTFLARQGTDVVARVKLKDDSKTVENLWYEESLPTETVLVALVDVLGRSDVATTVSSALTELAKTPLQLGGKATVGRGRAALTLFSGNSAGGKK